MLQERTKLIIKWVLIIIIGTIMFISLHQDVKIEDFGGGALTQLYAKGPQDTYLSEDAYKYLYFFHPPLVEYIWNNPTRINNYPLYGMFPIRYMPGTNVVPYRYIPV